MANRPIIEKTMTGSEFKQYYYLKSELAAFCRQEGLSALGTKPELTRRIAVYLDTGEKAPAQAAPRRKQPDESITYDTKIPEGFVCSERVRAFFKSVIGKNFAFHTAFQQWLKHNAGKTYREAVAAYYELKNKPHEIGEQFEYNTYIRDFFAANPGKSLSDAIVCWNGKKALPGSHRYEPKDLKSLDDRK